MSYVDYKQSGTGSEKSDYSIMGLSIEEMEYIRGCLALALLKNKVNDLKIVRRLWKMIDKSMVK